MQFLYEQQLEALLISEEYQNDGHHLRAKHIYSYLSKLLYARRSKFNPLWNVLLVAGWDDGKPWVPISERENMGQTDDARTLGSLGRLTSSVTPFLPQPWLLATVPISRSLSSVA